MSQEERIVTMTIRVKVKVSVCDSCGSEEFASYETLERPGAFSFGIKPGPTDPEFQGNGYHFQTHGSISGHVAQGHFGGFVKTYCQDCYAMAARIIAGVKP